MTSKVHAGAGEESPVFFKAANHQLFGILTEPTSDPLGTVVIPLPGGATPLSTNRNRLSVRLCREVARLGFHALRFDYHGIGESEGQVARFELADPFTDDLMGAVTWAHNVGLERVVLIGSCFGGRTALTCAPHITGLEGVALIATPVRDFAMGDRVATDLAARLTLREVARRSIQPHVIRNLRDPVHRHNYVRVAKARWRQLVAHRRTDEEHDQAGASRQFTSPLSLIVQRSISLLLIYGSDEDLWRDFERARAGYLGDLLAIGAGTTEIRTLPGPVHGFTSIITQDAVLEDVLDWLDRLASGLRGSAS